jgi:chaperonin GroES
VIEPLGHRVLVKVEKPEETTKGGIVLIDQVRQAEQRAAEIGTVVAIGPTAWAAEGLGGIFWADVGDKVYFAKYAGKWVGDKDDELLILNDVDLMAKVEDTTSE